MHAAKKSKGLRGGPSNITTAERETLNRISHRTSEEKRIIEDGAALMRSIVTSMKAQAASVGIDFTTRIADPEEIINEEQLRLHMAEAERWVDASKAVTTFIEVMGSAPTLEHGEYSIPAIPMMDPATMKPYLREKVLEGERSCVSGSNCYVHQVIGWPLEKELVALTEKGMCALCHDNFIYKVYLDQTSKDPRRRLVPDPNEGQLTYFWGTSGSINSVQYKFGPGGYKLSLRLCDSDLKPPTGVIGLPIVPSLGHFAPVEVDGIWTLDDTARHFP